ncbi:MAG TPA: CPBP family intramembrane glutamic endopeptidase [Chitinophaga sp.]|uniref:CPBP family intramembrane glutamic endopeptidase n=1 Tax=Chitinophaga sp. TaxID=1869181 RepID=UPI002DBC96FD|nr:CPBP family intramembrane glutamic endopeptidase [Chitinophaga sp.]HEU4551242.1 CPBP family intramembrane glutamic endopeptidase [Chitinophaga sp.]
MTGYLKQSSPSLQFMAFIGIFIGFMLLYGTFLYTGFPALSGYTVDQLQGGNATGPKVVAYLKLIQFLYTLVVYLVPGLLFAYLSDPQPAAWLGLHKKPKALPIVLALLIMYCSLWAVDLTANWNQHWPVPDSIRQMEEQADALIERMLQMPTVADLVINMLMIAVLPAIAEEVFFRGVMQRLIIQLVKLPWLGVLITAILFSAVHMQLLGFVPRVLLGILLGAIYLLSGNLWLSMLGHFLVNGIQVLAIYLYQVKLIDEDPSKSGTTSWYVALISALVTIALLWVFYKRTKLPQQPENLDNGKRLD